jgi:tetratricopeptide (TPR) repeat protein
VKNLLRIIKLLAAADLLMLLVKGSYQIPFTAIESKHPATSVFVLLCATLADQYLRGRGQKWTTDKWDRFIFLAIWAVYLVNFRWRGSGDVVAASLEPFALLRQGNLYLDAFYDNFLSRQDISWVYHRAGHVLSMYTSAPGLLLTPVYLIPAVSGVTVTDLMIHQLQKIGASFMVALSAYFVLRSLSLLVSRRWALILTIAYAFGTSSWSTSSQAIWQHGPSELFLSIGIYALLRSAQSGSLVSPPSERYLALSGFSFAMAIWCRYSNVLVFGCVELLILLRYRSSARSFLAGSIAPFLAILADNYFHSGSIFKTGYQPQALLFTRTWLPGFLGLLVSPSRGLLFYSPFLVFSVWGFGSSWSKKELTLWRVLGVACFAVLIFYSCYEAWCGGWCFGPRYLADIMPLLILGIVPVINKLDSSFLLRRVFILAVAYSILVHALGSFLTWSWEAVPPNLWSWSNYPVTSLLSRIGAPSGHGIEGSAVLISLAGLLVWFFIGLKNKNLRMFMAASGVLFVSLGGLPAVAATERPPLSTGVQAFQAHRWLDAMAAFLEALRQNPNDVEAHKYIPITVREIEAQNRSIVRGLRLNMLNDATNRLENERLDAQPIQTAMSDMTHRQERAQDERWSTLLEQARVEHQLGHLLAASDLTLRIIAEKHDHRGAQQELSLLLADISQTLNKDSDLLVQERYTLEGFNAYAQGDYDTATGAWRKARAIVQQTYPAPQAAQQLAALRFERFSRHAESETAEKERIAKTERTFKHGVEFYEKGRYAQALEAFREVAFSKPDYPQLAYYLVHSENGVEEDRTRKLTEARRKEIAATLAEGIAQMEHEKYAEAEVSFQRVLALDSTNPQARSYMTVVQGELQRRHDPKTAQIHYEAGLVAYASGKLEEAAREWKIATRMDSQNEKAVNALAKVQRELAFSRELR